MSKLEIGVKPLAWHSEHGCDAKGLGIYYSMGEGKPDQFEMTSPFHSKEAHPQEKMQAVAQADFQAKVFDTLTFDPHALVGIAFETAAQACTPHQDDDRLDRQCKSECATKIRSLIDDDAVKALAARDQKIWETARAACEAAVLEVLEAQRDKGLCHISAINAVRHAFSAISGQETNQGG